MTKQEIREKAKALGLTVQQFLRSPAITRWYGVKPKDEEAEPDKR